MGWKQKSEKIKKDFNFLSQYLIEDKKLER